jgi:hypothetical protein
MGKQVDSGFIPFELRAATALGAIKRTEAFRKV